MINSKTDFFKANILIVEDSINTINFLYAILSAKGYKVISVNDSNIAISVIQKEMPDLILLDIMMPGKSGYDLCDELKNDIKTKDIPIIFSTVLDEVGDKVRAFSAGGVDYITKPFQLEELFARIEVHLSLDRLKKELKMKNQELKNEITRREHAEKEHKKLYEQLLESHKMNTIGTLAGGVAHNFNNILSIIIGYTQIALENEIPPDSPAKDSLKNVIKASIRAKDLVNQLLTFSCKQMTRKGNTSVALVIKESMYLLKASLPANIELKVEISEDTGMILGDSVQIQQIILNLVSNAKDSMSHDGGVLKITLDNFDIKKDSENIFQDANEGAYIKLSVSDTGHGINKDIINNIFDPFFTTKEVGQGMGMGLPVIYGIVKNHNGFINVKSKIGKGTVFDIIFPIVIDIKQKDLNKKEKIEDDKIYHGHGNILLVDDEALLGSVYKTILSGLGYSVDFYLDSIDALKTFQNNPNKFDLVIADIDLPNMTGYDLSMKILEIRSDIPVILITGYNAAIDKDNIKTLGIQEILYKPFTRSELSETVSRVLNVK
ncbi:MAG: response regulator [Desulfobacterales bacterium]|nr:response regulator [Desulfobacterales bacterium]